MKIQLMSDVHLEFAQLTPYNENNADVLVLAGDICVADYFNRGADSPYQSVASAFLEFFEEASAQFPYILYVPGNHEHYHGIFGHTVLTLTNALSNIPNLHILDCDAIRLGDVQFVGGTLWTNFRNSNPIAMEAARMRMNDYHLIKVFMNGSYYKMPPEHTVGEHHMMLDLIRCQDPEVKTVVITHHAPSEQSIAPEYKGNVLNPAYASSLEDFILDRPFIKLWMHGHVHHNNDYMIGDHTRVVSNPRGYNDENPHFNLTLVLEV